MNNSHYIPLKNRAIIKITGADNKSFLQGLITNDIELLTNNTAIYSLMLTPQGKYLFDFFLCQINREIYLDCDLSQKDKIIKKLSMYRLRSDVEIHDESQKYEVCALIGDNVFAESGLIDTLGNVRIFCKGAAYIDPRSKKLFARSFIESSNDYKSFIAMNFELADELVYDELRIILSIPEGEKDLISEASFPLQFQMDSLNSISFTKGCYVGQEVTARSKHRGKMRKAIYKIKSDISLPENAKNITMGDKNIGMICSKFENIAIGVLDIEKAEESIQNKIDIFAGDIRLEITKPAIMNNQT